MMTASTLFSHGSMIYSGGILDITYKEGETIDEHVLISQIHCRKKLTENNDFYMLLDMREARDITDGALKFASVNPCFENVKAIGVVTRTGQDHLRAKLYTVFDQPNIRTKAFLSVEDAKDWFSFLEKINSEAA